MATGLYYEVRGVGPPILLLHGAGEDSSMLRPQAEALADCGFTAITCDRRGTARSPREGWPGDVNVHVGDVVALLATTTSGPARVIGFSSGGVIALALAAAHPEVMTEAIAWEPAALGVLPDADRLHGAIMAPVEAYLQARPDDWTGAYDVMLTAISDGQADLADPTVAAMRANAEAAVRDDARVITRHRFGSDELRRAPVLVAVGSGASPLHGQIADRLAQLTGRPSWVIPNADDHEVYLHRPEVLAAALRSRANLDRVLSID